MYMCVSLCVCVFEHVCICVYIFIYLVPFSGNFVKSLVICLL